jgi:hypothetical protein
MARVLIKPITVRLIAFGQKANIAAIRSRACDLLKDEHGSIDPAAFAVLGAKAVHEEISARRLDTDVVIKPPTPSLAGIAITLGEVNERLTVDWLHDLPVAKTCVVFATWTSHRDQAAWQLLIASGGRWSESRPLAP